MPRHPGLTNEEIEQRWRRVMELTHRGLSVREISETVGLSIPSVKRIRAQHSTKPKKPQQPLTPEERQRIEELLADGCSIREVARTLDRSWHYLTKLYRGRGWTREQVIDRLKLEKDMANDYY